jgi:penicillin-binding protein 1A
MTEKNKLGGLFRSLFVLALAGSTVAMLVGGGIFWYFSRGLPQIMLISDYKPATVTQVIVQDGDKNTVIGEFYKERRYVIPYEQIPARVVNAFISAEDDQFFNHQGINLTSIIRAAIANFRAGHVVQGGSTITQQVAKSLLLTPEKSFVRKAKELILAGQMERNLSKSQILYLYLNQIYLGHGAYGVQAASRVYFDKNVADLTIAEAALVAGMPQAPGKYSPHLNPKKAKERQAYVLRRMYENKFINADELSQGLAEHLKVHEAVDVNQKFAPYYVEHIRRKLLEKYGETMLYEGGLIVTVHGNVEVMKKAGEVLKQGLRAIDKRSGYRGPLKKFKKSEDIEKELVSMRLALVMKELGYDVLMPDGSISTLDAVQLAGLKAEADLLKKGSIYNGIVTSFDDKKKTAGIMVGVVKTELPVTGLAWARAGITQPKQLLNKGDLVQIRVVEIQGENITVALEQDPEMQAALYSLDLKTGQVLAMEGGFDFTKSEFNRATQAQRQVGSSYKPIIFSAALEKGFTPASIIVDSPIVYNDEESGKWKPANFEHKFYGDTTFRQALIKSRNIPTIKIVQEVQVPYLISFSKRLGMNTQMANDLSIALGSSAISLSELTKLYAIYPRLGRKVDPIYYSEVKDRDGKILEEIKSVAPPPVEEVLKKALASMPTEAPSGELKLENPNPDAPRAIRLPEYPLANDPDQVLDPRIAFVATHLMKEVVSFGTGQEAKALGRPAAGKTGTTNDYLDAWFMGFTPYVVTGVWVGYDAQKPIGNNETGARAALPIWLDYMKEAVKNSPELDFPVPPGVVFASIHPQTGKPVPPNASYAIKEAFIDGTEPKDQPSQSGNQAPARSTSDFLKEDIE